MDGWLASSCRRGGAAKPPLLLLASRRAGLRVVEGERLVCGDGGFVSSGASLSMSLSDGAADRRPSSAATSIGRIARSSCANRCMSSRNCALDRARVEKRAYSYRATNSAVAAPTGTTSSSARWST
ncbi:hypothetical protein CDD83_9323 [Cordyceps sp. RAO-2017]|nr:hypothetical protein CDD83_9323 [Cordyceps sp. RAO-2017]